MLKSIQISVSEIPDIFGIRHSIVCCASGVSNIVMGVLSNVLEMLLVFAALYLFYLSNWFHALSGSSDGDIATIPKNPRQGQLIFSSKLDLRIFIYYIHERILISLRTTTHTFSISSEPCEVTAFT